MKSWNRIMEENFLTTISPLLNETPEEEFWLAKFTSQQTRRTYRQAIQHFIRIFGITDAVRFRKITPQDILRYRDYLEEDGYRHGSICNRLSALSSLYNHLESKHLIETNPVRSVKRPKPRAKKSVLISQDDARKMLDTPQKLAETKRIEQGQTNFTPFQELLAIRDQAILFVLFGLSNFRTL